MVMTKSNVVQGLLLSLLAFLGGCVSESVADASAGKGYLDTTKRTEAPKPEKPTSTNVLTDWQVLTTEGNYADLLKRSETHPVLMMFSHDKCGACVKMLPIVKDQNEKDKNWVWAYTDTYKAKSIALQYQLKGVPTLVMLWKGKEVDRNLGFCDDKTTRRFIARALGKAKG